MPADVDMVVQVHQRILEALNVQHALAVVKRSEAASKDGASTPVLARRLEDCLWRWASAADSLRPLEEGPRLPGIWALLGRLLQQSAYAEASSPDVIIAVRRLLGRTTDEVPADDAVLKKALHALFEKLEYEPQLVKFVGLIIGKADGGQDLEGVADGSSAASAEASALHPRVKAVVLELLPSFRNLRNKFLPKEDATADAQQELGPADQRRIFASPTPQKAARMSSAADVAADVDMDGDAVPNAEASRRHSDAAELSDAHSNCSEHAPLRDTAVNAQDLFNVPGGPPSETSSQGRLFKSCFAGCGVSSASVASGVPSVRSLEE